MKSVSAFSAQRVINALRYSWQGLRAAYRDEAAFRQELMLFVVLGAVALWLGLPAVSNVLVIGSMFIVMALELLNSGLEALVDMTSPEKHTLAGKAKDCASAAVLLAMIACLGTWLTLAGPAMWHRLLA